MTKQTWIIAGLLSILTLVGGLGLSAWQQGRRLTAARAILAAAQSAQAAVTAQAEELQAKLTQTQERVQRLEQEKAAVTQTHQQLEQQMRAALESKDVTITELQGKLTVNILDRILFDSGEAVVKPEGQQVLRKIAGVLAQYPHRQIHVIGHTDNVPIRASSWNRFPSNWELSTARATAAVRFLCETAGVDPHRLGAVGYGEFHPVAENVTPEGKAKNRRIALVVLSEELAGSDAVPTARALPPPAEPAIAPTNAPASTNLSPAPSPPPAAAPALPDRPETDR